MLDFLPQGHDIGGKYDERMNVSDKPFSPDETTLPEIDTQDLEPMVQDPFAALNAENELLTAQVAELKDKMLRALAESENTRRRAQLDVSDARLYAITNFAREMVNVYDNLTRALEAEEDKSHPLVQGVELTAKNLAKALEKVGVKEISPLGEKFNPHFHQAMFEIATDEALPGTIMQIMQNGFTIGERVLRPAMVAVAKKA
jgi:molecular chaperone GrpE